MVRKLFYLPVIVLVVFICLIRCASSISSVQEMSFTITDLKVQHTVEPLAIEDQHPVFSVVINTIKTQGIPSRWVPYGSENRSFIEIK